MSRRPVDLGSSSTRLEPPHGALEQLADSAGAEIQHIIEARGRTQAGLAELASDFGSIPIPESQSVVLFGSWGREELTSESDNDWAVVTRWVHPLIDEVAETVARCRELLENEEGKKPGAQGVFATSFTCEDLVAQVGLDADSNTNLTRRMLLLLESVEVVGDSHQQSKEHVLRKYLDHGIKDRWPPRFLLNDLIRYWRTICVDFEGKHWDPNFEREKWVTRNAKLRTARKVLYAGGLIPVLRCQRLKASDIEPFLLGQLEATPLNRISEAFLVEDAIDEGGRMLSSYDRWLELIGDETVRDHLKGLDPNERKGSDLFMEIVDIGETVDASLRALLFETGMAETTKRFGIF